MGGTSGVSDGRYPAVVGVEIASAARLLVCASRGRVRNDWHIRIRASSVPVFHGRNRALEKKGGYIMSWGIVWFAVKKVFGKLFGWVADNPRFATEMAVCCALGVAMHGCRSNAAEVKVARAEVKAVKADCEKDLTLMRGEVGKARTAILDQNAEVERYRDAVADQAKLIVRANEEVERLQILAAHREGQRRLEVAELRHQLDAVPEADRCEVATEWVVRRWAEVTRGQ